MRYNKETIIQLSVQHYYHLCCEDCRRIILTELVEQCQEVVRVSLINKNVSERIFDDLQQDIIVEIIQFLKAQRTPPLNFVGYIKKIISNQIARTYDTRRKKYRWLFFEHGLDQLTEGRHYA